MFIYGNIESISSHYTPFAIKIGYTENIFSHDKKFLQCKVDFSFSYMGQNKINYIMYMLK